MEYKVVFGINADDLAKKVNELLKNGWILQGGVCAVNESGLVKFYQALVRI